MQQALKATTTPSHGGQWREGGARGGDKSTGAACDARSETAPFSLGQSQFPPSPPPPEPPDSLPSLPATLLKAHWAPITVISWQSVERPRAFARAVDGFFTASQIPYTCAPLPPSPPSSLRLSVTSLSKYSLPLHAKGATPTKLPPVYSLLIRLTLLHLPPWRLCGQQPTTVCISLLVFSFPCGMGAPRGPGLCLLPPCLEGCWCPADTPSTPAVGRRVAAESPADS